MLLKGTVKTNPVRMLNARAIVVSTNTKRPWEQLESFQKSR